MSITADSEMLLERLGVLGLRAMIERAKIGEMRVGARVRYLYNRNDGDRRETREYEHAL